MICDNMCLTKQLGMQKRTFAGMKGSIQALKGMEEQKNGQRDESFEL